MNTKSNTTEYRKYLSLLPEGLVLDARRKDTLGVRVHCLVVNVRPSFVLSVVYYLVHIVRGPTDVRYVMPVEDFLQEYKLPDE